MKLTVLQNGSVDGEPDVGFALLIGAALTDADGAALGAALTEGALDAIAAFALSDDDDDVHAQGSNNNKKKS
ncbi:MAG: hypothetical protein ABI183_16630 [Polyangiaceae bacterium]